MIAEIAYALVSLLAGVLWLVHERQSLKRKVDMDDAGFSILVMVLWPFICIFLVLYGIGALLVRGVNKL